MPTNTEGSNGDARTSSLVGTLLGVSKSMRTLTGIVLRDTGLHPGQDVLLLVLTAGRRLSVGEVAALLAIRSATVSKMVDILEMKKLVVRSVDESDARKIAIKLTEAGVAVQARIKAAYTALASDLERAMGDQSVTDLLARVNAALTAKLAPLR